MLYRVWSLISFIILSYVSQYAQAMDINTNTYDIYIGNVDDSGSSDYYFAQKPLFVLLHGDIATPLFLRGSANFLISGNAGAYSAAQSFSLTDAQLAAKIASGQLKLAQSNSDIFTWNNGTAGQLSILLRGATASDAALLLTNTIGGSSLPTISKIYSPSTYIGISDRTTVLSIVDVNSDGKKDIVLGSYLSTSAQVAYLTDTTGFPNRYFEAVYFSSCTTCFICGRHRGSVPCK